MFGSLMMFAAGVLASSPSSASASGTCCSAVEQLRELGEDPAGERDVAQLDLHVGGGGERLHDRQQRGGGERGRLVGVGVDDLHQIDTLVDAR